MGQDEFDAMFSEIVGAQEDMPALDTPAETEVRQDGIHYVATNDGIATYEMVVMNRVIFHVLVNEAVPAPMPAFLEGKLHPEATVHSIMIATADRSVILPTNGLATMGKRYLKTDTIRRYVYPRAVHFMIQVHNIGA
jgi:hypothetical protein